MFVVSRAEQPMQNNNFNLLPAIKAKIGHATLAGDFARRNDAYIL